MAEMAARTIATLSHGGVGSQSQLIQAQQGLLWSNSIILPQHLEPETVKVDQSSITYEGAHLLGVPQEIRNRIYEAVRDDINTQIRPQFSQHPLTGYEGLWQASRQLYHEVPQVLGTFMVPHSQIHTFLNRPIQNHSIWDNFKSLYLEIPHNSDPEVFTRMAHALMQVAHELQDLRIYGIGIDAHGFPTSSQTVACGKFDNSMLPYQSNLAVSGQGWKPRLPLVNTIQYLINLRTLVLDNLNMPLLMAHVLKNKPLLESLYIHNDHRTTLHADYRYDPEGKRMVGNLMWPISEALELRELHVTMNSAFRISYFIAATARTLEKLTIVVPDQSKQSACQPQSSWTLELAQIFQHLLRTQKLHTLKICIHGAIYENCPEFGELIGAFKMHMPRMSTLKTLEIHLQARSSWIAQDFFDALPKSLERLYVPDMFVTGNFKGLLRMITGKTGLIAKDYDHTEHQVIGEVLSRRDYIRFGPNDLSFVGYEYEVNPYPMSYEIQGKDAYTLLKLNARLLDKRRNRHLAESNGSHIPLDAKSPASKEEYRAAITEARAARMNAPMFEDIPELHVFATQDQYFGNEDAAWDVFHKEAVAKAADLPRLTYPVVVDVSDDFKHSNHWISEG